MGPMGLSLSDLPDYTACHAVKPSVRQTCVCIWGKRGNIYPIRDCRALSF